MGLARSGNFEDDFAGTDRFTVIRRLGAGGMGVVYEVHDQARHEVVALKTLRRTTPAGIYRLKQEFRSLAGMSHPNVVGLYELFIEDSRCFFTMELVQGVTFVDYVRQGSEGRAVDRSAYCRPAAIDHRSLGAPSFRQASSGHQAVQRARDAGRTRGHSRLRFDHGALS